MKASGRYQAAWKLQPSSHAALYNWGVALSDLARVVKAAQKDSAHSYLQQAGDKYQMSLKLHPHNPQACLYREIQTACPGSLPVEKNHMHELNINAYIL